MPTYPVINKETGREKRTLLCQWCHMMSGEKRILDWDKDWNAGVAGLGVGR